VVVLSFSASKRSPYMLPVAPAVAILVSGLAERRLAGALSGRRGAAFTGLVILIASMLTAGGGWLGYRVLPEFPEFGTAARVLVTLLVAGGIAVTGLAVAPRFRRAVAPAALLALVFALELLAVGWILPAADAYKSPRSFCERVDAEAGEDGRVATYRTWQWRAGYTYYLDRPLERIVEADDLRRAWRDQDRLFVIVERGVLDDFLETVAGIDPAPAEPLLAEPIGSNFAYLFTNRPTPRTP
jgi:hypothetical protein